MRVTLTKHGGFTAGMKLAARTVDTAALAPDVAQRLRGLVAAASGAPGAGPAHAVPDAMSYSITVEDAGTATTLVQSDAAMSRPFAELLDYLQSLD